MKTSGLNIITCVHWVSMPRTPDYWSAVQYAAEVPQIKTSLADVRKDVNRLGSAVEGLRADLKETKTANARWSKTSTLVGCVSAFAALVSAMASVYTIVHVGTVKAETGAKIRLLADVQGQPSLSSVAAALSEKTSVPPAQLRTAQLTAKVLLELDPKKSDGWQAAATVVNYRSVRYGAALQEEPGSSLHA